MKGEGHNSVKDKGGLRRLRTGFYQSVILLVTGVIIGVVVNMFHPTGISWIGEWSQEAVAVAVSEGLEPLSLEEAMMFHEAGVALFVDVRDRDAYRQGHLPGARSVPIHEAEGRIPEIREMADAGMIVIPYCHGVDCNLSSQLALTLTTHGLPSVRPFVSGLSAWMNAGYPVERGDQ